MKHVKLFENFVNEADKKIEKEAKTWWSKTMRGKYSWDADDMDMFIDHLMNKGLVDPNSDDLSDTREELEAHVQYDLGYEFDYQFEKYSQTNEARDMNDPILIAMRAKRMEIEREKAAPKKRKLSPAQLQKIEDQIWKIDLELKGWRKEYNQLMSDMELEAGQMGVDNFEAEGRHDYYGGELEKVESNISKLKAKKQNLELKLVQ